MSSESSPAAPAGGAAVFTVGDVVQIRGLHKSTTYNGQRAVVRRAVKGEGRWKIALTRGVKTLSIKPQNMAPVPTGGSHAALEVWPRARSELDSPADIPISPINDWPEQWTKERTFLQVTRGWVDPQLFGFASEAALKPDFQLYYDAADVRSHVNELANLIARGTPSYKFAGVTPPKSPQGYRGNIVIVYSPTSMDGMSSSTLAPHGPDGTTFSVTQLQKILAFFTTAAAVRKGKAMDDPMTRMFSGGGTPEHAQMDAMTEAMLGVHGGPVFTMTPKKVDEEEVIHVTP